MTVLQARSVSQQLEVVPVAGRIGAEIRGVQLSADLDKSTVDAIRAAWLKHKVVFFRNQHHLDEAKQEALTSVFGGAPVAHPTVPVIPEYGGDTVWANTASAYQDLSPTLRELADKLWALHSNEYDYAARRPEANPESEKHYREVFTSTVYETEHPLVRVHPETGERTLVSGHFIKNFIGYNTQDSDHLFALFQNHITRLENTVRWRWAEGDVAIWDNRATQHYAINDYGDAHRVMRRITVSGDAPVAVDGQRSRVRPNPARSTA